MCFYIDYDTNKYQKRRKSGGELSKNPKSLPEKTIVERIKLMPQKWKIKKLLTILTVFIKTRKRNHTNSASTLSTQ